MLTVVGAVVGVTVLTYSSAASWISALNQSQVVNDYAISVNDAEPSAAEQIREARAYNSALSSGALLAANANVPEGMSASDGGFDYFGMLKTSTGVMARLQIPDINLDLPIYHGTSEATLEMGIGHLEGTSLPVGGASTHSVLTGHRGLPTATLFTDLDRLEIGDVFTITTFGEVLTYRIVERKVVAPEDTETLRQVEGEDLVTLVTCTPLGVNSHRILVTGQRETPAPPAAMHDAAQDAEGAGFPWWAVAYGAALVAIAVYAWWAGRPSGRRHEANDVSPTSGPR
ncbi:class C sortase [Microbacterium sp. LWH10-1.2]|uniref:class C sortase n=1 Tax=unclassified Microbacterium TaxID=2609290 RepID=UPI0031393336